MSFSFKLNKDMNIKNEVLSGLTVALALVPEAIAFAFVAGLEPLVGLYAAFIVGFITSIFGGRPGMISGATGALAVVMVELVLSHGPEYLFATVVLMGIFQIIFGLLKLGGLSRLIPKPVMLGFVNGLAIVIFTSQLEQFKYIGQDGLTHWLSGTGIWIMIGLVVVTMAIIYFLPKITSVVPASLVAIISVSLFVIISGIDTKTVGDIASIGGGLPQFSIPNVAFTFETFKIILPYSIILASIGLIESLMTLSLIDEITETKGNNNKECFGQGLANVITGFFGGMGGCAMIGQSMVNVSSGGRNRLSGISASLFLLTFILFGSKLIEVIPIAVLVGVMFMVVISTFEWTTFKIMKNIPKSDGFVIVIVTVVTVFTDLAEAVAIGIIVSALVFVWKYNYISVDSVIREDGIKEYYVKGAVFFGSTTKFIELFDYENDPDQVIINFKNSKVFDYTAIDALDKLNDRYEKVGKKIRFKKLSSDCYNLINDASDILKINVTETNKVK